MDTTFLCLALLSLQTTWADFRGPQGPQQVDGSGFASSRLTKKAPPKPAELFSSFSTRQAAGNSAFMAYKTSSQVGNDSDILTFDSVATNEGNNFDVSTGIFTCTIPGTYVFSYTVITADNPIITLARNQDILATVFRSYDGTGSYALYDTISNQAVTQLQQGDQVGVYFMGYDEQSVYGNPYFKYTTFSGYLLF